MSSMGSPRRLRSKLHSSSKSELRGSDPSSLGDRQRSSTRGQSELHRRSKSSSIGGQVCHFDTASLATSEISRNWRMSLAKRSFLDPQGPPKRIPYRKAYKAIGAHRRAPTRSDAPRRGASGKCAESTFEPVASITYSVGGSFSK